MNRSNRLKNKNSRRFSFSNILAKEVLLERMEDRIVPAYVSGDFGWASTFETTNIQIENVVRSTVVDASGSVYKVGSFTGTVDFDPGTGTTNLTAVGGQDAFVEKLDSTGKLLWVKTFSGTANEKATSITLDSVGNPIITGWYQGTVDFDPSSSVFNQTSQGAEDAFILKLNPSSALQWAKSVGGSSSDGGMSITTDSSGNILVGGWFYGTSDFDPSSNVSTLSTNSGSNDLFALKLSPDGNYNWAKAIIGITNSSKAIWDIRSDVNNNIFLTGLFDGALDLDPSSTVFKVDAAGGSAGFIEKLDSNGNFLWGQQIGTGPWNCATSIAFDSQNNLYVTGHFQGTWDFDASASTQNKTSNGDYDVYLLKLSSTGLFQWVNTWGSSGADWARTVVIDSNNLIKVANVFYGTVDFDPSPNKYLLSSTGKYDFAVSVFDTSGNFFGVQSIGQPKTGNDIWDMTLSPLGQIVITGVFSGSINFDPDKQSSIIPVIGTSNFFITQWNRQFTKTTMAVSDSLTGANTTLTATIQNEKNTSTTGTVTFTDLFNGATTTLGTANVVNGVATLTLPTLATGVHNFTAAYSGDSTNFSSASNPVVTQLDAVAGSWGWAQAIVNRVGTEESANIDKKWGWGWDVDNSNTTIRSYFEPSVKVATDSVGNVWYGGTFTGNVDVNSGAGTLNISSPSGRSIYLIKTNRFGVLQDSKVWSGDGRNGITGLSVDKSGAVIITGYYYSSLDFDPSTGVDIKTSNGGEDGFAVVMNSDGTYRYSRTFGGTSDDFIQKAYLDNKASLVVAGVFKGTVNIAQGVSLTTSSQYGVTSLINYSTTGAIQYARQLGSDKGSTTRGLAIDYSTNSVFWAVTHDTNTDLDPGAGISLSGAYGASIIKLDENGIYQKSVRISTSWADGIQACDLIIGSNGTIYTCGWVYFDYYPSATEFFYCKYDTNLTRTFIQEWITPGNAGDPPAHTKINVDQFGNVYLAGSFVVSFDLDPSSSTVQMISKGNDDIFYAKFSPTNQLLNYGQIGGTGFDRSYSAALSPTGSLILGGFFTGTVDFDPTSGTANLSTDPNVANSRSRFVMSVANLGPVTTATSLTTTPTSSIYGQSITLNAALNALNGATPSGLTASFYDGATLLGTSTLTNGLASLNIANLAVGSHSLTAKIVDATNAYLTSTSTAVAFTVNKPDSKSTVTSTTSPSVFGQSVTFTATVAATTPSAGTPTGTVTFKDGTTVLGTGTLNSSGIATYATSALSTATHTITVVYTGDTSFATSTSANLSQVVNQAATLTTVTSGSSSSVFGQTVTFTATVAATSPGAGTPTGTVTFKDGTTILGTGALNSSGIATLATSALSTATHTITVVYTGDTNFTTSNSTNLSQVVNQAATSTTVTSGASSSVYGQSVTFTATVAATSPGAGTPTGTVTFKDGTTVLGTETLNSSGIATYAISTLAVGSHTITSVYSGDTNFTLSTSSNYTQSIVTGNASSLTISAGNNQTTTVANDFATLLQVRATDSSGNPVPNVSVTFTINANGASGSFASSGTVTTNASGYATAPKITANMVAGNFTVTVSATGVSNVVFNLTNTAGAASAIVLTSGNNQNTVVNTAFAQALQAKVTDNYGNPIAGIPVTFGVPSTGATASFAASNIVTTNASGLATAPTLSANTVAGSYQVSTSATGLNTQNFNLINNPGAASTITIQDGNNQSATVGAAFVKSLQVLAKDAYGNTVPGLSVTFTEPNTGATGTFASSGSVTTNSVGVATSPVFTANTVSGSYQVVASATGLTSQNFNLTNNAGIATGFAIVSGNNQTVTVGNAFATNLQVKATDTYGNGVPGVSVQFSAPGSGASGSFAGSNLVSSNSQGIAIAPTFTSNTIAGSYTVLASATGLPTQTFTLTNSTSGATIAVTAGNNQSATVGSGFGTALQVKFSDSFGNPVSGVSVTFAAPTIGASGTFNGTATVTSNASGIATAPAFTANGKAGNFTVTASAANVGSVNFNLTNTAGAASAIVLASGNNQMTTVNTSFGSPLMARVTDVYGNPVQNVSVTFSGPGSGSLAVFGGSTIVSSNADGIVASPTISANTVAGTYTVTASASNVTSAQFTLTNAPGLPTSIVKTGGNNQAIAVNTAFASPLSVKVADSYGNPVSNVNIAFSGPSTGSSLAFSGASTVATNALGVATTPAISANSNAGTYSVQAYLNDSVTANFTLTNLAGVASKLQMVGGNFQTATVNANFSSGLQALVTDAFSNVVSNAIVTFNGPASGAGVLVTGSNTASCNSSGVVSWSAFMANKIAGTYTVVASINGSSPLNYSLTNQAGAAAIATVTTGANQSTVVNTGFGSSLQVKVTDTFGNPVSNVPVTFATPSSGASASFSGSPSLNTNSDGVVNSPTLTANTAAGTYSVTATVGNVGQSIFSLTNLAGTASAITKTSGNNQSTVVTTAFSNPLQLKVTDAYGNPVANVPVSFTTPNSGSSLFLGSTTPVSTNAQGIVSSPAITANTVAGNFAVTVTANGNLTDSFSLTNLAGAASAIIKTSGNNQSTVVNTAFSNPLQLKVTDAYGNPVANVPVSFNVPSSGASLVLGSTAPVSTNTQGIATSPVITANTIAGGYSVNVTANGNITDSFTFTNLAGAAAKFTITAGDKQSTTVNTSFASGLKVLVTDTFNNPVPNTPVTFTVPSSGASVVLAGSNVVNTNSTGNTTLDGLTANKIAGSFTVLASVSNLQTLNFSLTNNPGAVASLLPVSGNNQSSVINEPFPTALQVKVLDAFGNIIPNVTVAFTSPTTGASAKFTGATSANSDNSGVASLNGLVANGVVGSYSVTATATGATNATFALRNAAPTVQSLVVQQGSTGRSFVRYVDLNINDAVTVNTLVSSLSGSAPKIRITNTGLDGKAKTAVVIKGLTKASGNLVKIDFGTNGIGGNAATNVGDGSYLIEMDLDGNGSFETSQRFFRLLGDVNGDKVVDAKDTALVKASLNKSGSNLPADTNGDGKVNASDTSYVAKAQKRKIIV